MRFPNKGKQTLGSVIREHAARIFRRLELRRFIEGRKPDSEPFGIEKAILDHVSKGDAPPEESQDPGVPADSLSGIGPLLDELEKE